MKRGGLLGVAALVVAVLGLATGGATAHYVPQAGDNFHFGETVVLDGGIGNYTGYTEHTFTNGSIALDAVDPNGTENASYQNTNHWTNNEGQSETYSAQGRFTFSANTFHYVQGTDNQTGYVDPYVWFFMDNSLGVSAPFYLLNTEFRVVSTNESFALASSPTGWVRTLFAEGNGSYQRNDVYGVFTATYTWKAYFDPVTGYIVGYLYTEQDRDGIGDGFTLTDTLAATSTSYALTPNPAPPTPPPSPAGLDATLLAVLVVVLLAVVLIAVAVLVGRRARRGPALPRHAPTAPIPYDRAPYPAPPPIHLTPGGQPPVQQIVIKETVKTNCRYCGALIDTTVANCPNCGAPRS